MTPDDVRALKAGRLVLALVALLGESFASHSTGDPDEHLSEAEAMAFAKKSKRQLSDARRAGELTAYGKQGSRTFKRGDLVEWLEARASKPVEGPDDPDIERRVRQLSEARAQRRAG